jgi:AcrR family transcriptional regulator
MEDVAAACGITKLIVYRHFGSKEELYRAILQRVFDRLGDELRDRLSGPRPNRGLGVHTQLTVAREDPDGYRLLWRHAAREPMFAAYAASTRQISVDITRQLLQIDSGDETLDRWTAEVLFAWLVESTLAWLDTGAPDRDADFVDRTTSGFWALRQAWTP